MNNYSWYQHPVRTSAFPGDPGPDPDPVRCNFSLPDLDTVCPRSSDPFYVVSYYIKLVTTSWTYSIFWLDEPIFRSEALQWTCLSFTQSKSDSLTWSHILTHYNFSSLCLIFVPFKDSSTMFNLLDFELFHLVFSIIRILKFQ